jgi:hypothetical protein
VALLELEARDTGKVEATDPSGEGAGEADKTLPDPTNTAKWALFGLAVLSVVAAILLNALGATPAQKATFTPSQDEVADFALFAGFYVIAQVLAAVLAVIAPFIPPWRPPAGLTDSTVKAAQTKADRAALLLGLGAFGGVLASCLFGFFFLEAVGIHASPTVDAIFTGAVLAGGAKPLHDFIALIQNKTAPNTGTGDGT